jgi:succinate dehydrogenase / fumarate reductase flavoprotein subunit
MELINKIPDGPLDQKWTKYKNSVRLVNPSNKRNIEVIVVGTGLAGSSAAASAIVSSHHAMRSIENASPSVD